MRHPVRKAAKSAVSRPPIRQPSTMLGKSRNSRVKGMNCLRFSGVHFRKSRRRPRSTSRFSSA